MPYIYQISIVSFSSKSVISGVVLNSNKTKNKRLKRWGNLKELFYSYLIPVLKNATITIFINKNEFQIITNNKGTFIFEVDYSMKKEPVIDFFYRGERLEFYKGYPIFFKNSNANFGIISDIDDTILVSHTANLFKRIGLISIIPPQKRETIAFTQRLLTLFKSHELNVFYVSKSESNLFEILSTFIFSRQLPKGKLFLTPHLNFRQLINEKKEKDFKLRNIQFILINSKNKKFILFGDDTQRDMEVYESIARNFESSVARIYIRQTKKSVNTRKKILWNKLIMTFPNSVYFNKNTDIDKEITLLENLLSKKNSL